MPVNVRKLLSLVVLAGCGRLGFDAPREGGLDGDAADDAHTDANDDAASPICHTGTWATPQVIASTVTSSEEGDPGISEDELTLFFESNRAGSQGRDIWVTTRASRADAFGTPTLVVELQDAADDYDPVLSRDGLTLYFGSLRSGTRQVYTATRSVPSGPFSTIAQLPITGDTVIRTAPDVSPDELTLYYARDLELAYATRPSTSVDFTFVREVDEVNVSATDGGPSVTDDGLELFFDSYRDSANGGLFTASRTDTASNFGVTTELTSTLIANIPTATGAASPTISADGRTLYFWAKVGAGQLDLYTATRSCD
jgi:Tol biopolymer transport system component